MSTQPPARVLVTGGAGFIGSHYVRTLLAGGYPGYERTGVTVLDKLTYAGNTANLPMEHPRLRFVRGDITDQALLRRVLPGHDQVVHFAAESHVDRSLDGGADFVRTNVGGTQAAFFREAGNEYPIIVRLREQDRERIDDINDILVSSPQGQVLQAKNLLTLRNQSGPTEIQRKNQERIIRVTAEPEVTLSDAVSAVNGKLTDVRVPPNFSVGFGSEVEEQARAFNQLQVMLILAVVLVYAVMASQYESLRDPFIVMFSVPVAAIGVVAALKLTATSFSLQAYIGVIMLAGIVVSNTILLVDYTNILRRRDGKPLREAVELAGRTRLRPILMTTLATILGLVPMSLGLGEGAELQAPLARVVIGGLATSTLVTLVLVPTVYTLFEEGVGGLFRKSAKAH